ncbi:phosphoribosyltransferase, partial [Thiolapillus sp.]|uniref:phosphoribosyltransferase n=1 Tax=Thiolapillus sp. TaxID=2017437 RepID=UPI003AF7B8BD
MTRTAGAQIGCQRPSRFWGLGCPKIYHEAEDTLVMFAEVLSDRLGLPVETTIHQREKIKRTGTGSDYRLAFNPTFAGNVKKGQSYLIVDDTLTMGGTIASLRG